MKDNREKEDYLDELFEESIIETDPKKKKASTNKKVEKKVSKNQKSRNKKESVRQKTTSKKPETKKEKEPKKKKKRWKKILIGTFSFLLFLFIVFLGGVFTLTNSETYKDFASKTYDRLATMDKGNFQRLANTKIYDKHKNVIGEINTGNFHYIKISDIPLHMQNAYIAAEDQNFKYHHGVDYKATIRAGFALIKNKGAITQGGSTITQQVIKNNILSQERSFVRKFMEILMAPELEKKYSKHQIMEFYCNSNYYGNGCYGIDSASRFYFGKPAKEMNLAESAMLAGVSNSPNNYNPVANMNLAKKKMSSILNKMVEQNLITSEEKAQALNQDIVITKTATKVKGVSNYMSSYAIHCATEELMKLERFKFQYTFESEDEYKEYQKRYKDMYNEKSSLIRGGGFQIFTSFDMSIQQTLQETVDKQLSGSSLKQKNGKYQLQGAAVCIDNKTNYIVAIVGGRGKEDQFNRGFLSKRQPGSSIKPLLVYGPAFDKGIISPASYYIDKKIQGKYSPRNANGRFLGQMNIRKALALSTNTVAYQVFEDVGQKNALSYLEKMNFSGLRYADNYAASISLGGFTNGVSVDEMAKGFSTIQHQGTWTDKTCIVELKHEVEGTYANGEQAKTKEIYNPDAAYMLTDSLQGVFKHPYGTGHYMDLKGQIAAGKSGTTNSKRDVWFCGYTNYYTTAVWVGNDNNRQLYNTRFAGKIWESFMNQIHEGKKPSDFTVPKTIMYQNVKPNGHFGSTIYDKSKLDMSKSSYERRPQGYDLSSGILKDRLLKYQEEKEEKEVLRKAELAVKKFEKYEIKDKNTAKDFENFYKETCEIVEKVVNLEKLSNLKTRIATKYDKLKPTYEAWKKKMEEEAAEKEKLDSIEIGKNDENNYEDVIDRLHDQRIKNMKEYLRLLRLRKYNTSTARKLVASARECLNNCFEYKEYKDLKAQFDKEVDRIQKLPTEVPKPQIPPNNADKPPKPDDYPIEKPQKPVVPEKPEVPEKPIEPTPPTIPETPENPV